jgi:hypothetical protein
MVGRARETYSLKRADTRQVLALTFFVFAITIFGVSVLTRDAAVGLIFFVACLPCLAFSTLYRLRSNVDVVSIGPAIVMLYLLFFLFGGMQSILGVETDFLLSGVNGTRNSEDSKRVLLGVSLSMIFFVWGYFIRARASTAKSEALSAPSTEPWKLALLIGVIFSVLASAGLLILSLEHGGLSGIADRYGTHSKIFEASVRAKFGHALWLTFHPIAAWLLIGSALVREHDAARTRWIALGALFILGVVGIDAFIFGSRTNLLILMLGLALILHRHFRAISGKVLFVAFPLVMLLSVLIVNHRTSEESDRIEGSVLSENAGHGVFEVLVAVYDSPFPRSYVADPERVARLGTFLVPRALWPNKPLATDLRLDAMVAQLYSGTNATGYPSSMFAEWYVLGGWGMVFLNSFAFGVIVSMADRWVQRKPVSISTTLVYVALAVSFIIYFKDGDLIGTFASSLKLIGLMAVVAGFLRVSARTKVARAAPSLTES